MRARDVKPGMSVVIIYNNCSIRYGITVHKPYKPEGQRYHRIPIIDQHGIKIFPSSLHVFEYRKGVIIR